MRLNKYIQENLGISRRKFVDLVNSSKVFLDWQKVESYGKTLKWWELLEIKGTNIKKKISLSENKLDIIIFNKPKGFVCSKSDKHNETIYSLLPEEFQNYFYIWRLDKDSRGLLIMTNDSGLVNKFEHPSNKVEKEYLVEIDRMFSGNDFKQMKKWIIDDWDELKVKTAKYFEQKRRFFVKIILWEWKKRHIRRILNHFWYKVLDLQRIREWEFQLWNIKEWNWMRMFSN